MKTKQSVELIVEPQDVLSDQLQAIKGGSSSSTSIECNPKGRIACSPRGTIKNTVSISAW